MVLKKHKMDNQNLPIKKINTSKKTTLLYSITLILGIVFLALFFNSINQVNNSLNLNSTFEFENTISLLAISEDESGNISSSSQIPLHLKIIEGEGNVFVNLNSYTELDTQISITNSNNVICTLLELPCNKYDFYYTFEDASLVLKGPSASTSIAILTFATINTIELDNSFALTGALNSNGIIGIVGGVEEKVKHAEKINIETVFIPINSINESTLNSSFKSINVIESLDIIEILNELFPNHNTTVSTTEFSTQTYTETMKFIAEELCELSNQYINQSLELNISINKINSSLEQINNSKFAQEVEEYYSQGSFCYSANLNLRAQINLKTLNNSELITNEIKELEDKINEFEKKYNSITYSSKLDSLNDIYVFLLVKDRLSESFDFLNNSKTNLNKSLNQTEINLTNSTRLQNISIQQLSFAQERFNTVLAWETLFNSKNSKDAKLNLKTAQEICQIYNFDIQVLNQMLHQYEVEIFDERVKEIEKLFSEDPYKCIYTALELKGQMNSIVAGATAENDLELEKLISQLQEISVNRMQFHSQGQLPLIPYISYEYSKTLQEVGNLQSALLYAYSAMAYSELNILLDSENNENSNYFIQDTKVNSNNQTIQFLFLILAIICISLNIKISFNYFYKN